MNTLLPLRSVAASALAAAALSACVVTPAPYPASYPGEPTVIIQQQPPAPYAEVVPAAPYPGAVWISGYWGWARNRHEWVPGRYERPRPGYRWHPHRWHPHPRGGWALQGGIWGR